MLFYLYDYMIYMSNLILLKPLNSFILVLYIAGFIDRRRKRKYVGNASTSTGPMRTPTLSTPMLLIASLPLPSRLNQPSTHGPDDHHPSTT